VKVATASEMRRMDARAIGERGIPGIALMERAGQGAAREAARLLGPPRRKVVVVCGKGNNGGDGFVVARRLAAAGHAVLVCCTASPDGIRGDAGLALAAMLDAGIEIHNADAPGLMETLGGADLIVDALLGTGVSGEIKEPFASLIEAVNAAGRPTLAIDIPSGLCADRGVPLGPVVQADVTVTFALPKLGLLQYPGASFAGRVVVVDIGIPEDLLSEASADLLESRDVARRLPSRREDAHKGDAGRALVVAGSPGLTGAACLAARAACRAGAGLVTVAAAAALCPSIEARLLEAMTWPVSGSDDRIRETSAESLVARAGSADAVAIGPGLGRDPDTLAAVRRVLAAGEQPGVVDAAGLMARPEWTPAAGAPRVLTPHPGEMAALLGKTAEEVQSDRPGAARRAAERYDSVVVLKGAGTLVAEPSGAIAIVRTGHPGMASGGMGDVLTGIVAALLAQGLSAFDAAAAGAYVHGYAAELAAEAIGAEIGVLAGDVIEATPRAMADLKAGDGPECPVIRAR